MKCPKCKHDYPKGGRFCPNCGWRTSKAALQIVGTLALVSGALGILVSAIVILFAKVNPASYRLLFFAWFAGSLLSLALGVYFIIQAERKDTDSLQPV